MPTPPTCPASPSSARPGGRLWPGRESDWQTALDGGLHARFNRAGRGGRSSRRQRRALPRDRGSCSLDVYDPALQVGRPADHVVVRASPIRSRLRPRCVRWPGSSIRRRSWTRHHHGRRGRPRGGPVAADHVDSCCSPRWRSGLAALGLFFTSSRSTYATAAASSRSHGARRVARRDPPRRAGAAGRRVVGGGPWPRASAPRSSRAAPSGVLLFGIAPDVA